MQEEVINKLRKITNRQILYGNKFGITIEGFRELQEDIDTVLNMIKEKNAEIEKKDKRIQELEEERDHWHGCFIVAMENSIAKEKVIDVIQEYKDKVEQYNEYKEQGKETDVEYYENIANTIVIQVLQELLEGEK